MALCPGAREDPACFLHTREAAHPADFSIVLPIRIPPLFGHYTMTAAKNPQENKKQKLPLYAMGYPLALAGIDGRI
jgi:hypothetical protein